MHTTIDRRSFLRAGGAGFTALALPRVAAAASAAAARTGRRPNILFIMTDDHAAHALSCYGSVINRTPNLDRLAAGGMRFDHCFCTNSISAPSRAVILTGKYSHLNGVRTNGARFDGEQVTFPKLLRAAGYATAMVGKWHLKSAPTGFGYYHVLPGQGAYHNPAMIENGERHKLTGYTTDVITDEALKWLEGRPKDKPFCMMLHHKAPHRNWSPKPEVYERWKDVRVPEPATFDDDYATRSDAARRQRMQIDHMNRRDVGGDWPEGLEGRELKAWKYQRYMRRYLACVESVDLNVGRVLDYLDEAGLTDETMVVYTSDQGFYLGDHGWFDKRFMYEESLRMPLLVRYPQVVAAGSTSDAMVLNLDFAQTFCDFAQAEAGPEMQGRSMRPVLAGNTPDDWRTSMYYHYYEYPGAHSVKRHYGVRTERHKLMHFYHDIDAWELYDLAKDPRELNNVYADPAYAPVVAELKAELERLRTKYRVPDG